MTNVSSSFDDILNDLRNLHTTEEQHGREVFLFAKDGKTYPVYFTAGAMDEHHWFEAFIGLNGLGTNNLELATLLLQINHSEFSHKSVVPRWLACGKHGQVLFVFRMDWRYVSAQILDKYIKGILDEVNSDGFDSDQWRYKVPAGDLRDDEERRIDSPPEDVFNCSFTELLDEMKKLHSLYHDPNTDKEFCNTFDFDGRKVKLLEGAEGGLYWMDIVISMYGFRVDRFDWARELLDSNGDMGSDTPIPTFFASDSDGQLLFINRLDWRYLPAKVLKDHIDRCIRLMGEALIEQGIGTIAMQRHHGSHYTGYLA